MKLLFMFPLYDVAGDGAGGGSNNGTPYTAGSGGGTSDRGAGGVNGQQGQGGNRQPSGQTSTPYKLTDDSLLDLGDGQAKPWRDIRTTQFVNRSEHDSLKKTYDDSRNILMDYAKKLDAGFTELEKQRRAPRQPQAAAQPDITEELTGMPIVDGQTAAKLVKQLRENGLAPIAQIVAQQQATIKAMQEEMKGVRASTGTLTEHHQSQEFESHISGLLKDLPEVKGLSKIPADNPTIRAIAQDLWLSYDPKTWTPTEFRKMFAERLGGLVQLLLDDQQKVVKEAKESKRKFFDPRRGSTHPSGQGGGYKHLRGFEIARDSGIFERPNA